MFRRGPTLQNTFTLTVNWNSFHVVGDIPIATSVFEGEVTRDGKQIHFRGKNLLVWKKQADGSWKIFRYMSTRSQRRNKRSLVTV